MAGDSTRLAPETFAFRDVNVAVVSDGNWFTAPSEPKRLVHGVSSSVKSGQILGIMGPSGAGKTSLLDALMGVQSSTVRRNATVTLNGQLLTSDIFRTHCACLLQMDRLWSYLTCREHLQFALELFQAELSADKLSSEVDRLLSATGLVKCADVRAGNDEPSEPLLSGLSGGQRRRLSLALALSKRPAVLLADEPTSGLDDAAAAAIMALVGELARSARMAAVCTIHQPSSTVYAGIDTLLLLSRGQTAYNGPAADLLKYLAAVGKPVPTGVSLTEHALNLVNADFMSESQVETMLAMWRKRATANAPAPVVVSPLPPTPKRANLLSQFATLARRNAVVTSRDPQQMTVARLLLLALVISLSGITFSTVLERTDQLSSFKLVTFIDQNVTYCLVYTFLFVRAINGEKARLLPEFRNGMFDASACTRPRGAQTRDPNKPHRAALDKCARQDRWLVRSLVTCAVCAVKSLFALLIELAQAAVNNLLIYAWAPHVPWHHFSRSYVMMFVFGVHYHLVALACGFFFGDVVGTAVFLNLAIVDAGERRVPCDASPSPCATHAASPGCRCLNSTPL
jgi:ABC-type multidrug transport system ATPase subunit